MKNKYYYRKVNLLLEITNSLWVSFCKFTFPIKESKTKLAGLIGLEITISNKIRSMAHCDEQEQEIEIESYYTSVPVKNYYNIISKYPNSVSKIVDTDKNMTYSGVLHHSTVCMIENKQYFLKINAIPTSSWRKGSFIRVVYNQLVLFIVDETNLFSFLPRQDISISEILESSKNWYMSEDSQLMNTWKSDATETWGIPYNSTININQSITTHYFKQVLSAPLTSLYQISIKTNYGFILYANGIEAFRYGLPTTNVDSTTKSLVFAKNPSFKQVLLHKNMYYQNMEQLILAVEVHMYSDQSDSPFFFEVYSYGLDTIPYIPIMEPLAVQLSSLNDDSYTVVPSISQYNISSIPNTSILNTNTNNTSLILYFNTISKSSIWVNGYRIQASSTSSSNTLVLYGLNSNNEWIEIDQQNNLIISTSSIFYTIYIPSNKQYFQSYKLLCTTPSSSSLSISRIQLINTPYVSDTTITLPQTSYLRRSLEVSIKDTCDTTKSIYFTITRSTSYVVEEYVKLYDENDNLLDTIQQNTFTTKTYEYCVTSTLIKLELGQVENKLWSSQSSVTVTAYVGLQKLFSSTLKTIFQSPETYSISLITSIGYHAEWKYNTYMDIPTEWYGSIVDDSTWNTVISTSTPLPTSSDVYTIYRKTIDTPTIIDQKAWLFAFNTEDNIMIYINDHQVYKTGFKDGYTSTTTIDSVDTASTTGPLSFFSDSDTITISVLIYNNIPNHNIAFDGNFMILVDTSIPYAVTPTILSSNFEDTSSLDALFDLSISQPIELAADELEPPTFTIQFIKNYLYMTRYCISIQSISSSTPVSWNIYALDQNNQEYLVSSVENAFFSQTSYKECFMFKYHTEAYYGLRFDFLNNYENVPDGFYEMAEISFFVDNLEYDLIPSLSTTNPVSIYINTDVTITFDNHEYYSRFSASPSLPSYLKIDSNTGTITGFLVESLSSSLYTITAYDIYNNQYTYNLVLNSAICRQHGHSLVRVTCSADSNTDFLINIHSFSDSYEYYRFYYYNQESYTVCLATEEYMFDATVTDYSLETFNCSTYINNEYINSITSIDSDSVLIYISLLSDSVFEPMIYAYDNKEPPKHWNTNLFNEPVWSSSNSSLSFPSIPEDSITQYYRIHYSIDPAYPNYAGIQITASTYAGMVIYLNGVEVRRINLEKDIDILHTTLAVREYTDYISFITSVNIGFHSNVFLLGDNIVSIEVHRGNTIPQLSNKFRVSVDLLYSDVPRMFSKDITVNGDIINESTLNSLLDRDYDTYVLVNHTCVNTVYTYAYNDRRKEMINQIVYNSYAKEYGNSFSPSSFIIEGNNNNDDDTRNNQEWTYIYTYSTTSLVSYQYSKFYNDQLYNRYRIRITECFNDSTILPNNWVSGQFNLMNEISYQYVNKKDFCSDGNEWTFAYDGKNSNRICEKGYYSDATRTCTETTLGDIEGSDTCIKRQPNEIFFRNDDLYMNENESYLIYYSMDSVSTAVTSTPSLPEGLSFDIETQSLYGIPTTPSPRTLYTLSFKHNDEIYTGSIYITVGQQYCQSDDNLWYQVKPGENATISCPLGYIGNQTRLCLDNFIWGDIDTSNCTKNELYCTGNTYLNTDNICEICINGVIISKDGNNIDCKPCSEGYFIYNNECILPDPVCSERSIGQFTYPSTLPGAFGLDNCTDDNHFGYSRDKCESVGNGGIWNENINNEMCYPKPLAIMGTVFQHIDYVVQIITPEVDTFTLLYTSSRVFIKQYAYELFHLMLATNHDESTVLKDYSYIHVFYGINEQLYNSTSLSTLQYGYIQSLVSLVKTTYKLTPSYISTIHSYISPSSSCTLPNDDSIHFNVNEFSPYYCPSEDSSLYYHSYFCIQHGINYISIPIMIMKCIPKPAFIINIELEGIHHNNLTYESYITLYRGILAGSTVPIKNLHLSSHSTVIINNIPTTTLRYTIELLDTYENTLNNFINSFEKKYLLYHIDKETIFYYLQSLSISSSINGIINSRRLRG
ncbi:hypothetical protein WA158_004770 [Blastocystis sp. Blastoise]